jgi:hypothetical protein
VLLSTFRIAVKRKNREAVARVASVIAGTKPDLNIASVILTAAGAVIIGRMILCHWL